MKVKAPDVSFSIMQVYSTIFQLPLVFHTQDFSFSNFLHKCVYNEFIDQYRKRQAVSLLERKYIEATSNIAEQDDQSFEK